MFNDTKLVSFIRENLEKNCLEPSAVILEITEQVAVRHHEEARGLIHELMAVGCRFALDDFGSGFSSFNYLKHLPVDYIKIDGGFIRNITNDRFDQAMVKSIIQIARAVGKQTIAEYVQDGETLAMLHDLGVDYAQGFHIGKPAETLMSEPADFKSSQPDKIEWQDFQDEYIQMCIRWHLHDKSSYRQLEAMMLERGVPVRHTTIHRWVKNHAHEPDENSEPLPEPGNPDYRVTEMHVLVEKQCKYLYRAISANGTTLDFVLYDAPDRQAAVQFFRSHLHDNESTAAGVAGHASSEILQ